MEFDRMHENKYIFFNCNFFKFKKNCDGLGLAKWAFVKVGQRPITAGWASPSRMGWAESSSTQTLK